MRNDCEMACDARVLSCLEPEKYKKYGETLINLLFLLSNSCWDIDNIGIGGSKKNVKKRVIRIALLKGMIKFLEENRSQLSEEVLYEIEERIAFWERELEKLYIGVPDVSYDYIKVETGLTSVGDIKKETIQFYSYDPSGRFNPLNLNGPPFQSEEDLIATGYEEMKILSQSLGERK